MKFWSKHCISSQFFLSSSNLQMSVKSEPPRVWSQWALFEIRKDRSITYVEIKEKERDETLPLSLKDWKACDIISLQPKNEQKFWHLTNPTVSFSFGRAPVALPLNVFHILPTTFYLPDCKIGRCLYIIPILLGEWVNATEKIDRTMI